jgi:hypothetical protein
MECPRKNDWESKLRIRRRVKPHENGILTLLEQHILAVLGKSDHPLREFESDRLRHLNGAKAAAFEYEQLGIGLM